MRLMGEIRPGLYPVIALDVAMAQYVNIKTNIMARLGMTVEWKKVASSKFSQESSRPLHSSFSKVSKREIKQD